MFLPLRDAVLLVFAKGGTGTTDEIARALRRSVLGVRPRVSELHAMGIVEKTGGRRRNRSGRTANVWRAKRRRGK